MTYELRRGLGDRSVVVYGTLPEAQEYVAEEFMLPRPVPASSVLPPVSPRKTRRAITIWRSQDVLGEARQHDQNMLHLLAWAAAGFAAAHLLSGLAKRRRPTVVNPRSWLEQEMVDWGVREWTPKSALFALKPHEINSADEYLMVCRDLWHGYISDARLLIVGFNHFSPRKWVVDSEERPGGYFWDFETFWNSTQPRPDKVGSSYNLNPETVFKIWKALGYPKSVKPQLLHAVTRVAKTFGAFEPFFSRQADSALRSKTEKTNLVLLLLSPELFMFTSSDRKRALRLMRRSPEDAWKVRWFISSVVKPFFEGPGTAWHFRRDYITIGQVRYLTIDWSKMQQALRMSREEFAKKFSPTGRGAWWALHRYVPRSETLRKLPPKVVAEFDKKLYLKIYNSPELETEQIEEQRVQHATGLMFTFGHRWERWIEIKCRLQYDWSSPLSTPLHREWAKKRCVRGESGRSRSMIHDATYWLPTHPSPGLADFLFKHHRRYNSDLAIVASRWNEIPAEERSGKFEEVLASAKIASYDDVEDRDFARVAAEVGVPKEHYKSVEREFMDSVRARKAIGYKDQIPDVVVERDGYKLFKMPFDSPKTLFIGAYSDCCMYPGGAAASCAWQTITSTFTATFAFTDPAGRIVASMWVWTPFGTDKGPIDEEGSGWLVIDSIEGPMVHDARRDRVFAMVDEFARQVTKHPNFATVAIGNSAGVEYPRDWDDWIIIRDADKAAPPGGYSDATYRQFIIRSPEKTAVKRQKALEEQSSLRTQEAFRQADRGEEFLEP